MFLDINECESNPCENDGACMDMEDGYECACEGGFTGTHCETGKVCCFLNVFIDIQTSKELIQMDTDKMMTYGTFTMDDEKMLWYVIVELNIL